MSARCVVTSVSASAGEMVSVRTADDTDGYESASPELKTAREGKRRTARERGKKRTSKPFVFCQDVMCQTAEKGNGKRAEGKPRERRRVNHVCTPSKSPGSL